MLEWESLCDHTRRRLQAQEPHAPGLPVLTANTDQASYPLLLSPGVQSHFLMLSALAWLVGSYPEGQGKGKFVTFPISQNTRGGVGTLPRLSEPKELALTPGRARCLGPSWGREV